MTVKGKKEKVVDGVGPREREHSRPVRKWRREESREGRGNTKGRKGKQGRKRRYVRKEKGRKERRDSGIAGKREIGKRKGGRDGGYRTILGEVGKGKEREATSEQRSRRGYNSLKPKLRKA